MPLCALLSSAGNGLKTLKLGGNGAWGEGVASPLVDALGSGSCVLEELDISGCGLGASVGLMAAEPHQPPTERTHHERPVEGSGRAVRGAQGPARAAGHTRRARRPRLGALSWRTLP